MSHYRRVVIEEEKRVMEEKREEKQERRKRALTTVVRNVTNATRFWKEDLDEAIGTKQERRKAVTPQTKEAPKAFDHSPLPELRLTQLPALPSIPVSSAFDDFSGSETNSPLLQSPMTDQGVPPSPCAEPLSSSSTSASMTSIDPSDFSACPSLPSFTPQPSWFSSSADGGVEGGDLRKGLGFLGLSNSRTCSSVDSVGLKRHSKIETMASFGARDVSQANVPAPTTNLISSLSNVSIFSSPSSIRLFDFSKFPQPPVSPHVVSSSGETSKPLSPSTPYVLDTPTLDSLVESKSDLSTQLSEILNGLGVEEEGEKAFRFITDDLALSPTLTAQRVAVKPLRLDGRRMALTNQNLAEMRRVTAIGRL
ncbi:hypothetical protein BT69DRAFT_1286336 [Atractiella rhizophila]|nr:hypothetical protein BT69DRAFT_1286336 [Atractiella rhizophila]